MLVWGELVRSGRTGISIQIGKSFRPKSYIDLEHMSTPIHHQVMLLINCNINHKLEGFELTITSTGFNASSEAEDP